MISNETAVMDAEKEAGMTPQKALHAFEPMWAALVGLLFAGDVLSGPAWVGCACMIVGRLRN